MHRFPAAFIAPLFLLMLAGRPAWCQGLPSFAPLNPVASSRSGVYFLPMRDQAPGRWSTALSLDYGSLIEYNRLDHSDYVLDSEVMRLGLAARRDIGRDAFVQLSASLGGSYSGFMDGFLDWYHGALGIRMSEREKRPQDRFLYTITLPDGQNIRRSQNSLFLGDLGVAFGLRFGKQLQSVLSLTLPTATGPAGYGKSVASFALLNTVRAPISPRLTYEGSLGVGVTPASGALAALQHTTFLGLSSGFRHRVWGAHSVFVNLFYHSPYYRETTLPALDRRDLSFDFGWILATRRGAEWRVGLTEDLEPGGPGVDLVLRVGRSF
jgi:Protein of unknown function (DUF3187)